MTLTLSMPGSHEELKPRITVFGVGGAGGNAVNNMIDKQLDGVEFVVANTDAQALQQSRADARVQMGLKVTEGLGAGARPAVGAAAAEETIEQIVDHLAGAHMCFITAGMGGGTGSGAAPIIAQAARELGVLTVGVVTKPFQFEGAKRMRIAEDAVDTLQKVVDTLIIIPNQNLFRIANERTTFTEAFSLADDVLYQGVKGVTDLMVRPGLINLDFADVRAVMDEMGKAMMGTGEAEGEDRAIQAAEKAIANPLLDEISLRGAKGVLINITGGYDLTLFELDEAANRIREEVDPDANIIVGSTLDTAMDTAMRVSVVATGIDAVADREPAPTPRRVAEPAPQPVAIAPEPEEVFEEPVAAVEARTKDPAQKPEPSLFSEPERRTGPRSRADAPTFTRAAPTEPDNELPAPVYQPAARPVEEPAPVADAGVPSAETLARLQAAVRKQPGARSEDDEAQADKGRFGINSLIGRMTGHQGEAPGGAPRQQPPVRGAGQPRVQEEEADPEQERIEIPAFLRRQAN
ncbi:MAG: cell division protein FtsZ [Pseudomonadota bacterium]